MKGQIKIEPILLETAAGITDDDELAQFLDWACRGDAAMRSRLEWLLATQGKAEHFFNFEPFESWAGEAPAGQPGDEPGNHCGIGLRIGRYRLVRCLGEGGYGVVYLAEQEAPLKRQVALKLIRVGLNHDEVIARFETERQALALMDHPGIAKVLDAGATATGRPFFVMEWVTGEKITTFCDKHRFSVPRRLELFVRVCHAVQHAHQKGIIHRDIKPSNVLVAFHDDTAQPKVIDFGIAKATAAGWLGAAAGDDGQERVLGTPEYMSPEQGRDRGRDVDTRSDIFSLGVLLCELLAGATPFGPARQGPTGTAELQRALDQRRPVPPTAITAELPPAELAALAADRSCSPAKLHDMLAGDLDAIVLKCLQGDRQLRYATASGLAADIQRHLHHESVHARPGGNIYRLAKLVRRNRLPFAVSALLMIMLATGFGITSRLWLQEAEAKREQARLRAESEAARATEARLRELAEARERCAQAAVRISYGKIEEADQLVAGIPPGKVPSSLEANDVFTKLGEWHMQAGRWDKAAERFTAMAESHTLVDATDSAEISLGTLYALGAICRAGDWARYAHLRSLCSSRFSGSRDSHVAEQVIRLVLLRPADSQTMQNLTPLAEVLRQSILRERPADETDRNLQAWSCVSHALWYLRNGNHADAVAAARHASVMDDPWNLSRDGTAYCIEAMALWRLGNHDQARAVLAKAEELSGLLHADEDGHIPLEKGYTIMWWDRAIMETLLAEARQLMDSPVAARHPLPPSESR